MWWRIASANVTTLSRLGRNNALKIAPEAFFCIQSVLIASGTAVALCDWCMLPVTGNRE